VLPVLLFLRFGSGYTALHVAAAPAAAAAVAAVLHVAAAEGSAEMCSLLIDGGADVNAEATG
jgi:ankyrin repeat protein